MVRGFGGGFVDEDLREQMVTAVVEAARVLGSEDYEEGMRKANKLVESAHAAIQSMQTVDTLRATLNNYSPASDDKEQLLVFVVTNLPSLIRFAFKMMAKKSASNLPTLPTGRPQALDAVERQRMLDFVSQLYRKGVLLKDAKLRASQEFRCSQRTVERAWANRQSLPKHKVTVEDLIAYFAQTE